MAGENPRHVLSALLNHVTLPPRLPFKDDLHGGATDRALAHNLAKHSRSFRNECDPEYYPQWSVLCRALDHFATLHSSSGYLSRRALESAFVDLANSRLDILILHLATQNAGLLIQKANPHEFIFEAFEASPRAADVLASEQALQWDFPSHAVAIASKTFEDPSFQEAIAKFLEQASIETVKHFAATTAKAGSCVFESRDTANPAIIGQLLMAILEANGSARATSITRKRVRDDVCWNDGAEIPWRRSAAWLVLRVGLQRSLFLLLGGSIGTLHYKFFICYFIARLCNELCGLEPIDAGYLAHVRAKLARRLAKLQMQRKSALPAVVQIFDRMFDIFEKGFSSTLKTANDRLAAEWSEVRHRSQKRVPRLQARADDSSLVLSLVHSREHLQLLCRPHLFHQEPLRNVFEDYASYLPNPSANNNQFAQGGIDVFHYLDLADFESEVEFHSPSVWPSQLDSATYEQCSRLAENIHQYQLTALSAYSSNPEQLSLMLLTIMELWTALDSMALQMFPLLREYSNEVPTNVLHVLQIARLSDLRRLQAIEDHLRNRQNSADPSLPSIFSDPSERCFAVRYFDQCGPMQDLLTNITSDGDRARELKKEEWKKRRAEYEDLLKKAAEKTCLYHQLEDAFGDVYSVHDERNCEKHYLERAAKRVRITIDEYPLPNDRDAAKAAVFELYCPRAFATWRDTTWNIISKLGRVPQIADSAPPILLQEYSGLENYGVPVPRVISLASRTKSFLNTHYAQVGFPIALEKVCLPNGLRLGMHDHQQMLWTARQTARPSFASLCTSSLPSSSSFSSLRSILRAVSDSNTPSANEIIASQTECPTELTPFEYISFQELSHGTKLRWIQLLRELASPNLNFSTPATTILVSQLALQAGSPWQGNTLRNSQWPFKDEYFCTTFVSQIRKRLQAISSNWRESQALECLVTLIQRLWELGASKEATQQAVCLLSDVRAITLGWTRQLRREILIATDEKSAQGRSRDAVFASLICRRTYVLECRNTSECLAPEALACFIECSIVLKDNMPETGTGRISSLPVSLLNMYIRDLKILHHLKSKLRQSIGSMSGAIGEAINNIWPEPSDSASRAFTTWTFLAPPHEQWISTQSAVQDGIKAQHVLYNFIEGTLLIDGQRLGRLPEEYTKPGLFQQLLGDRLYRTYPSSIPGMRYMLAEPIEGNRIHFGFRDGAPFMRASYGGQMLELIPPDVFYGSGDADLPISLINEHVHWLDLDSGILQITPQSSMWRSKLSDWNLNVWTGLARRRNSFLVDVRSPIFKRIASIIEPFEHRSQMIVFQPQTKNLSLTLPKLEMSFMVNHQGLLESRQLRAVIDDNQDAGTLYGLDSKLVLRDISNPRERSIVVTMGPAAVERYMGHVRIRIQHSGFYCRFSINSILNRLECPPEPRVIYMKAFCHALTAFVLADPLTGRTGTEEALQCLSSGNAQPWAPVDEESYRLLLCIANLAPKRSYYPAGIKVLQKVVWMESLAFPTQDDEFEVAVRGILRQCRQLYRFNSGAREPPRKEIGSDVHLMKRAHARNRTHRQSRQTDQPERLPDTLYLARDHVRSIRRTDAFEATVLIKRWSCQIAVSRDLAGILQGWPVIQGYHDNLSFGTYLLDELISLDIASHWGCLFRFCQEMSRAEDSFRAMFFFATISFGRRVDMVVIRTLIAFTIMREFQSLSGPKWDKFTQFQKRHAPTTDYLVQLLAPSVVPYPSDERSLLGEISLNNKQRRRLEVNQSKYEKETFHYCQALAKHLLSQWPCETPSISNPESYLHINIARGVLLVQSEWQHMFKNHELWMHLQDIQQILDTCQPEMEMPLLQIEMPGREVNPIFCGAGTLVRLKDLMNDAEPYFRAHPIPSSPIIREECNFLRPQQPCTAQPASGFDSSPRIEKPCAENEELQSIISPLVNNIVPVRRVYGEYLQNSLVALRDVERKEMREPQSINREDLQNAVLSSHNAVQTQFNFICKTLNQHPSFFWLNRGGLWPSLTPVALLNSISSNSITKASGCLRDNIIFYGELITVWQRLLRVEAAIKHHNDALFQEQLENEGHSEWLPRDYPDWLILEIENNILIRTEQYRVAKAMITPESGSNCVLQMNMGQGKSSVIIPMIAMVFAEGRQLFRVIIPKPLLLQMAQLLQARLGGLLGRTVKHVPFSRRSLTSIDNISAYLDLHRETLKARGVILALPEHLLSFKLSGLQRLSSGKVEEAAFMMRVQSWLVSKFRDVLDECDHTLAVKTQLVYPSGAQRMIDGHPNRWKVVQAVLRLAKGHLMSLQRDFPHRLEITERGKSGGFPAVHLSHTSVKDALIQAVTESVCRGEGGILPVSDCTNEELGAVAGFLSQSKTPKENISRTLNIFKDRQAARQDLLLLRGLLVHRILLMALSKRWNVQYGLHPRRDPVAVPFQAKGVPSEQAEFGHPDVSILLTCLSFYYSGLEPAQFERVLKHVSRADDPALDYDRWVQSADSLPDSLRTWAAINVDDESQCKELWHHLRYNMNVVDGFLNNFVFPYHAKTFERKLVSSAWDIPLPPPFDSALPREHSAVQDTLFSEAIAKSTKKPLRLTTGFSGTNDNRTLLPLNIQQQDLVGLSHTNAEVLTYLLQPRNRGYLFAADILGKRLTELEFLKLIHKRGIRMLLDAGAQILEFDNFNLVKAWLSIANEAEAAVYFDEDDKARVLYRDGRSQPLVASPYNDNLGACVVYLDEAHTRGTDLKMPANSVAALTLGPGQTKDHTVQAAMRLRRLATSQSVVFFAPPEVHQSILNVRSKDSSYRVDSHDVISWLLEQTCTAIEQIQPLYISQGLDYCQRTLSALMNHSATSDAEHCSRYLKTLEQPEQYSLERLYAPRKRTRQTTATAGAVPLLQMYANELNHMKENLHDTGDTVQALAHQEVEQEREVAIEVETVREVKKPPRATALKHPPLHQEIISFAREGRLAASATAYEQAFVALRRTALGMRLGINSSATVSKIFVTSDFMATIQTPRGQPQDEYIRPVHWILWSSVSEAAMIISPYEAEALLDDIRDCTVPSTHLISYAAPVTRNMLAFDTLRFYSIPCLPLGWRPPIWLVRDLGIIAGRLYFDYAEYPSICEILGLPPPDDPPSVADGWDELPFHNQINFSGKTHEPFSKAPLEFLKLWLSARRKNQDTTQTPMGHVCYGKELKKNSVYFT